MSDRTLAIVVGHVPRVVPAAARSAGLDACLAVVLDTARAGAVDLVIDAALWLACLRGVADAVGADASRVHAEPPHRWLERFRTPRPGPVLGSLESHGATWTTAADPDAVPDWDTVVWTRGERPVAVATRETWFRVGGPAPYHDSDTTSLHVAPGVLNAVLQAVRAGAEAAGGRVTAVSDLRSGANATPR